MLLHTAAEEIGHIEMLATAVAMNLESAPLSLQETAAEAHPIVNAVLGGEHPRHIVEGMLQRHLLSTGLSAMPTNADGVPFDCSHVYASGNLAADMYANVTTEATGRILAVRLFNAARDPGMKDMLSFLAARDTMHQQQWLAAIEEMGRSAVLPIPNSFDQAQEQQEFSYVSLGSARDGEPPPEGRFTSGPSLDGNGTFSVRQNAPLGQEPMLGPAQPNSGAQVEQIGRLA